MLGNKTFNISFHRNVNSIISTFLVIINGTSSLDQDALCGYKISSGESVPAVKPDCLLAARNSGQSARLGSPFKNSFPSMKIEGSNRGLDPCKEGWWQEHLDFLQPKCFMDATDGADQCGLVSLASFKNYNILFSSFLSLCFRL